MSRPAETVGVIVAHGVMAEGLVSAARGIAGAAADCLVAVSNEGKSPPELVAEIGAAASEQPAVIFVDLQTGSCGMAALTSCRGSARRAVVCGVNLPMLLDFVFHRMEPFDELLPRLVEKGKEAIRSGPMEG